MDVSKLFASKLGQYRTSCGISQEQMAERCGISCRHYSDYECGKVKQPKFSTVLALAKVANISLDEIRNAFEIK
jgi:Predicted transcriptional regulators